MDKRTLIITKAIELFAESGFDNTSIRELAKKANVNLAMINYYFGSKEKLFAAVIEYKSNYLKTRLEELRMDTGTDEMQKINIFISESVTRILANPYFHRILHQELLLRTRPEVIESISKLFNRNFKTLTGILEDGIQKNLFKKVDTQLTIATLYGTINHFIQSSSIIQLTEESSETTSLNQHAERMINYLQKLMQVHLLKEQS